MEYEVGDLRAGKNDRPWEAEMAVWEEGTRLAFQSIHFNLKFIEKK